MLKFIPRRAPSLGSILRRWTRHQRIGASLCWLLTVLGTVHVDAAEHPQQLPGIIDIVPEDLQSYPGAAAILYLDFTGEEIVDSYWTSRVSPTGPFRTYPSGLPTAEIRKAYEIVKEDYLPFNVNVTTSRAVFDSRNGAARPMRAHMVITPTDEWWTSRDPNGKNGIAQASSFRSSAGQQANALSGFVFVHQWNGNVITATGHWIGNIISHESGHVLGLAHDGVLATKLINGQSVVSGNPKTYFDGSGRGPQGMNLWAPIMGFSQASVISNWAGGGFTYTSNDDGTALPRSYWGQIIENDQHTYLGSTPEPEDVYVLGAVGLGTNDFGFRTTEPNNQPDYGDTVSSPTLLSWAQGAFQVSGIIGFGLDKKQDEDVFAIDVTAKAKLVLEARPSEPYGREDRVNNQGIPNLFISAQLYGPDGSWLKDFERISDIAYNPANPSEKGPLQLEQFLCPTLTTEVTPGRYYIRIRGSAYGSPLQPPVFVGPKDMEIAVPSVGFPAKGTVGGYSVSGAITGVPIAFTSPKTAAAPAGVPFQFQVAATNSPTQFSASGLPPGLQIGSGTGLISGIPTTAGTYEVTMTASNSLTSRNQNLTITVQAATPLEQATGQLATWRSAVGSPSGNSAAWVGQPSVTHDGVAAAQTGQVGHNQRSVMEFDVTGPGNVTFWWRVSSEGNADFLRFRIDGVSQTQISGTNSAWAFVTVPVTNGAHTLSWSYEKNGSVVQGSDAGWVDDVTWTPLPPVVTSATSVQVEQNTSFNYQLTATNGVQTYAVIGGLPAGLAFNAATGVLSGIPTSIGTYNVLLTAANGAGTAVLDLQIAITPAFAPALDAPSFNFTRGGAGQWLLEPSYYSYGGSIGRSPALTHSQNAWFQTTVSGPGTLSFLWRTDCEATNDYIKVEVNGVEQQRTSGPNTSWTAPSLTLPSGTHAVRWTYVKNSTISEGMDAAWVDQVVFTAPLPVITSSTTLSGTVGVFSLYITQATNSPQAFAVNGTLPDGFLISEDAQAFGGNPKRAGTWQPTISATNSYGTASTQLVIEVRSSRLAWTAANNLYGTDATLAADSDKDGWNHLAEMAFGLNPRSPDSNFHPVKQDIASKKLQAVFSRNPQYADLIYEVQVSGDQITWTTIARSDNGGALLPQITGVLISETGGSTNVATVTDSVPATSGQRRFMRIKVSEAN